MMCLIFLAYKYHLVYPIIIAANRDEYYQRPTASAEFWTDKPDILGGRDLVKKGTWLGVTRTGRFAAITNYRAPSMKQDNIRSRGELVSNFLEGKDTPQGYLNKVKDTRADYNGFNLLVGDYNSLWYYSNIRNVVEEISPGIHSLSNDVLNTSWTKVEIGKQKFKKCLQNVNDVKPDSFLKILANRRRARDEELPDTGVGLEWERILSSIFVQSSDYGTRSSTIVLFDNKSHVLFTERSYFQSQSRKDVTYEFDILIDKN